MPADVALPSVDDFLDAYAGGVAAKRDDADNHRGSRYEIWGGVGAVLFNRITARARGNFRNNYFDTAEETALDNLIAQRHPEISPRVLLTAGVGTITFYRPAGGLLGSIFEGTRVRVGQRFFVTTETKNLSTETYVEVEAQAEVAGTGQSIVADVSNGDLITLEDLLFDDTLKPIRVEIADGTEEENAAQFRSRVRVARLDQRVGYATYIINAMKAAGATQVALFASDYFGDALDHGLNRIYVADDAFVASADLLQACRLKAFESVTCGMAPQVLPLAGQALRIAVVVTTWNPLTSTARDTLESGVRSRIVNYLDANPYIWNIDALVGAAQGASQEISDVDVTPSSSAPTIATLFDTPPLVRWSVAPNDVTVTFA